MATKKTIADNVESYEEYINILKLMLKSGAEKWPTRVVLFEETEGKARPVGTIGALLAPAEGEKSGDPVNEV